MIKWSIHQEDISFVNIYAYDIGAPKNIKQIKLLNREIDSNIIIAG